jgi:phosphate transport system permease protein
VNKIRILAIVLLGLGVLLLVNGYEKGQLTYVEQVVLKAAQNVKERGDYSMSVQSVLKKTEMFAEHEITEATQQAGAPQDSEMTAQELATERLNELSTVVKHVKEGQAAYSAPKDETPFQAIQRVVEGDVFARSVGYYIGGGVLLALGLAILVIQSLNLQRRTKERLIHGAFFAMATTSIIILFLIMVFLFYEGLPVFKHMGFMDFMFGDEWYPTEEPPALEIFPLIIGSVAVTALSSVIAIPLGVMTAIYLAEIAPPKVRSVVKPMVEMLEALPSVVIGFFGMVVVAPFLQNFFGIPIGLNMFNASVMLAFMAVPTITSISEDAIYSVPAELKEASLALGATHWQSIARVILPASLSGITTATILGMARSIGETMVVLMVAGGAALIPDSIFDPVRPMPASIAAEMAEAPLGSAHYHALFAIGMVLFVFTLIFNLIADHIAHKYKQVGAATL